jgi:hypothetical protein
VNVVKYYRERGGKTVVRLARFTQSQKLTQDRRGPMGVAPADQHMLVSGFTRKRPSSIKPHSHPHQQSGYRQPSEQQRRRARQLLKGDRRP